MSELIVLTGAEVDMISGGQLVELNLAVNVQVAQNTAIAMGGIGGLAIAANGTATANGGAATATAASTQTANGNAVAGITRRHR